jgi:hypothetical protein
MKVEQLLSKPSGMPVDVTAFKSASEANAAGAIAPFAYAAACAALEAVKEARETFRTMVEKMDAAVKAATAALYAADVANGHGFTFRDTPLDDELRQRLRGDEPLIDVVNWYRTAPLPAGSGCGDQSRLELAVGDLLREACPPTPEDFRPGPDRPATLEACEVARVAASPASSRGASRGPF